MPSTHSSPSSANRGYFIRGQGFAMHGISKRKPILPINHPGDGSRQPAYGHTASGGSKGTASAWGCSPPSRNAPLLRVFAVKNILLINFITGKTMRHTFKLLAATVAAATICSCSTLTGYPTDAEASYAKAPKRVSTPTSSRSIRFRSWKVKPCRTTCSSSR